MEITQFPKFRLTALPLQGLSLFFLLGLPVTIYHLLWQQGWNLVGFQSLIILLYGVAAFVLYLEAFVMQLWWLFPQLRYRRGLVQGWGRRSPRRLAMALEPDDLPKCSVIIVAYLPNEQDIILNTLDHVLRRVIRAEDRFEVILAYNTPIYLPIEEELREMARCYPALQLLHVKDSHSKAENLNAALQVVTGEMTCILDADHLPAPDCLLRAWSWLAAGHYDVVQGRCVIRNRRQNWLTRWIGVEFDCLYGVSHPARSMLANAALFGGSNGYWRTEALQAVGFCDRMLTEDIDATLRALQDGLRIVNDPQIISQELAPVTLKAFWSQRQRWTQGWLEVAVRYQGRLPFWQGLDLGQKICWLIMLLYSSAFHVLTLQMFVLIAYQWLWQITLPIWLMHFSWIVTVLSIGANYCQAMVATQRPLWSKDILFYTLVSCGIFWLKILMVFVSLHKALSGHRQWVVTPRHGAIANPQRSLVRLKS